MLPRLVSVAVLPLMMTASVLPLTVRLMPAATLPVWPEPVPRICAVVDALTMLKLTAEASVSINSVASAASTGFNAKRSDEARDLAPEGWVRRQPAGAGWYGVSMGRSSGVAAVTRPQVGPDQYTTVIIETPSDRQPL